MKIDLSSVIGLGTAVGGILAGYMIEGGSIGALVAISPVLIIFGGTIGATMITQPMHRLSKFPKILAKIFTGTSYDYIGIINNFCEWTQKTRKEGVIAIDSIRNETTNPFIRRGLELVSLNIEPKHVREFLETEIEHMTERHHKNAAIFESAGGFSPTMGIIGTVLGLITILSKLGGADISELGEGIATAFLATFMGISLANLFCLPSNNKLRNKSDDESLYLHIAMEGILGMQISESPMILRKRLLSMLPDYLKTPEDRGDV